MYLGNGVGARGAEALQIFGATILVSGSDPITLGMQSFAFATKQAYCVLHSHSTYCACMKYDLRTAYICTCICTHVIYQNPQTYCTLLSCTKIS